MISGAYIVVFVLIVSIVFESIGYSLDKVKKNKSFYLFESNTHPDYFNLINNDNKCIEIYRIILNFIICN